MASGPPASAAESSKMAEKTSNIPSNSGNPHASTSAKPHQTQNPYAPLANAQQSYQNYWQNAWSMNSLYTGGASPVPPALHYSQPAYAPYQAHYYTTQSAAPTAISTLVPTSTSSANNPPTSTAIAAPQANPSVKIEADEDLNTSSPPPPPLPKYKHWDEAVQVFLKDAGLIQALRGFECDMIVMNPQWERTKVPIALENMIKGLSSTREFQLSKGKEREVSATPSSAETQDSAEPEVDRS